MSNDPDLEPPRYYIDDEPNGPGFVIRDSEHDDALVGTAVTTWAAAVDVCKRLNSKGK